MFDNFTDEELQDELNKRAMKRDAKTAPVAILEPDFLRLRSLCQEYIDEVAENGEDVEDSDIKHFIFEAALEALYGKEVWEWVNSHL